MPVTEQSLVYVTSSKDVGDQHIYIDIKIKLTRKIQIKFYGELLFFLNVHNCLKARKYFMHGNIIWQTSPKCQLTRFL